MSGMTLELGTPHGKMLATILAGIAQFERDLISERVKSGLAAAKVAGEEASGASPGNRPVSDRYGAAGAAGRRGRAELPVDRPGPGHQQDHGRRHCQTGSNECVA